MTLHIIAAMLVSSAMAAEPVVEAHWRKAQIHFEVIPAKGEHLAPDAPADGWVRIGERTNRFEMLGSDLADGLLLASPRSKQFAIEGEFQAAVCQDDGSACRPVTLPFHGEVSGSKGRTVLEYGLAQADETDHKEAKRTPEDAFKSAQQNGKKVLLEFSTVWCPPCQLLGAQVLHDPADQALLAPFEVVQLDADDPSSFVWKDRYQIGGYPTSVVTDGDGEVIARMLGYDGEAEYIEWLAAAAAQASSISEILENLDQVPEADRAQTARRLMDESQDEAAATLIELISDTQERELLRFQLAPTTELLEVIATQHQDRIMEWIWVVVYELYTDEDMPDETRELIRSAIQSNLMMVEGEQAAELAYVLADVTPEDQHPEQIFTLGAAIYRQTFEGEPGLDRGRYSFLASLLERAGDIKGAIEVMEEAAGHFPNEFTYHFTLANLLNGAERHEDALAASDQATTHAYGDMILRAARQRAEILITLDRKDEAKRLIQTTLTNTTRPPEGLKVRTWRYRELLEEALENLEGAPSK